MELSLVFYINQVSFANLEIIMYESIHVLNVHAYKFSWVPHKNILARANVGVTCAIYCACIADYNTLPCNKKVIGLLLQSTVATY